MLSQTWPALQVRFWKLPVPWRNLTPSSPGEIVARASSPASSGGIPPRERSLNHRVLAAGRCGNSPPGRLRHGGGVKLRLDSQIHNFSLGFFRSLPRLCVP
jgi:hypothetical protein